MTTFAHDPITASRRDAAKRLSALVTLETGAEIPTDQMLDLILKNWDRIAALAHQIHGTEARPADGGWIDWKGGVCPVPNGTAVEYKLRDGTVAIARAEYRRWTYDEDPTDFDLIAYRVVKP